MMRLWSVFAMALMWSAFAGAADSTLIVRWTDAKLTVEARNVSIATILEGLTRESNLRVRGLEHVSGVDTLMIVGQSLAGTVKIVLRDYNYLMFERRTGSGIELMVLIHSRINATALASRPGTLSIWHSGCALPSCDTPESAVQSADSAPPLERTPSAEAEEEEAEEDDDETDEEQEETAAEADRAGRTHGEGNQARRPLRVETAAEAAVARLERAGGFSGDTGSLMDVARSEYPAVRIRALSELSRRDGSASVPSLVAAVQDADPGVRSTALGLLVRLPEAAAGGAIESLLHDPDPEIRTSLVLGLRMHPGNDRQALLEQTLRDSDPRVRSLAREQLEERRGKSDPGPR